MNFLNISGSKVSSIFDNFPVIDLGDVILRNIALEHDYKKYYQYITSKQVAKYLSDRDIPTSEESARHELNYWARLFDSRNCIYWAIALKSSNEIIGTCGFNYWNRDHRRSEISYDLDYNFWRRGIMSRAVSAISNFCLQNMQVQRIQATVAIDNIPSIKVLEKSGFYRESMLKSFGVLHNESKDFYMYVRLE